MSEKKQTAKAKKNDDLIEVEEEENTFAFSNMGGNNEDEISVTKPGVLERERRSRGTHYRMFTTAKLLVISGAY